MKCPFCGNLGDKVVDSRESKEGNSIRRRRECLECGKRYTSREHIEEIEYRVIKKDGSPGAVPAREADRRPRPRVREAAGQRAAARRHCRPHRVRAAGSARPRDPTTDIGARIMDELRRIDQVAYVRFASVYRQFRDVGEFKREIDELQKNKG